MTQNCIPNIIKSIKNYENLIDLMMFGIQFFANFDTKLLFIFLKGVAYKQKAFWRYIWIRENSTVLLSILLRKIHKSFVSKRTKTAYKTSSNRLNFHGFWSIWWRLVGEFLQILKPILFLKCMSYTTTEWALCNKVSATAIFMNIRKYK